MRYLTKSRFSLALQCPTKLDYLDDPAYSNADRSNEFLLALAEGGHQVGALAKCLFPDGIEIDAIGHDAQVKQTEELLQRENVALFEAAIRVGRLFIRADLLLKTGNQIELYEVKAKGFDPADPQILGKKGGFLSGMKPYLYDVAFQRYVLRRAFPSAAIRSHLVMPNKTAICPEPNLAQRLQIHKEGNGVRVHVDPSLQNGILARQVLCIVPVDDYLDQLEKIPLEMGQWVAAFSEGIEELASRLDATPYPPRLGSQCRSCQFHTTTDERAAGKLDGRQHCLSTAFKLTPQQASPGTIFDIYAFRRTDALLTDSKILLADVEPEHVSLVEKSDEITLSHRQWLQSEEARGALTGPIARSEAIRSKIKSLTFPLHFIDFETSRPALPFHAELRPYDQLLFQFSHHRLETDGSVIHASEHLSDSLTEIPNFETVRALKKAIGNDNGSVLHWWDHERTVLAEVRDQLTALPGNAIADRDELVSFIDALLGTGDSPGRLFDLGRLVHRTVFFPRTRGSSSLKKVLPALLASSNFLQERYTNPIYGVSGGIPSLNFTQQIWVHRDQNGAVIDPYELLGQRIADSDLAELERLEEDDEVIANGGAAMVAYGLLQSGQLDDAMTRELRAQLLRYCELDTLAMVMAWEGLNDLLATQPT